jgi:FkbM family methyltransferase
VMGSRMLLDSNDYTQRKILFRSFEPREVRVVKRVVRRGDVCLDVGANVGFFTLLFARLVGRTGRVLAYEPIPANVALLRKNLELNDCGCVTVHEVAAGALQSDLVLGLPAGQTAVTATSGHWTLGGPVKPVSTRQLVLDDAIRDFHVRIAKIDVEGMESAVLTGLRDALAEHRIDFLLVEVALAPYGAVAEPLEAAGYSVRVVDRFAKIAGAYNVLATSPRLG